jgi:sirohydrochlorin ferrochelatase
MTISDRTAERSPGSVPHASKRPGLLIVDHGTRAAANNRQLEELARAVARERPDWLVEHAHMELAEPDFAQGIERLVERGADEILVHLHFLGAGFHVRESIPALLAEARARHPQLPIEATEPLGRDPRLVEIVVGRMDRRSRESRESRESRQLRESPAARQSSKA